MTQAPFPVDWRSPWEAPPIGVRIVAVYSDGSGAKLLVNLGGYFIDADGDSYCMDADDWHRVFMCWAILPPAVQLFCETVDVEPVTLPPQPCTIRTQPLYTEIERILDEKSAWIARPIPFSAPMGRGDHLRKDQAMTMTDAEIAAALEKATPGPWEVLDRIAPTCVQALGCVDTCAGVAVWGTVARALPVEDMDCEGRTWTASGEPEGNARLIAMAPALARLALDRGKEIERLRELVEDVHACLSDLFCECEDLASEAEDNPLVDLILRSRALVGGGNDAE